MDLEYIESLAQLVRSTSVAQVTVRRGEQSVTLRRRPGSVAAPVAEPLEETGADIAVWSPRPLPLLPLGPGGGALVGTEPEQPQTEIVRARRVGFFHRARKEGGEPLVSVGDWVAKGQQLASLESMKLYDEVDSTVGGVVLGVFVTEGAPVEYGQPLFHLEPCDPPESDAAAQEELS